MYESRTQAPISRASFARRLLLHVLFAAALVLVSLAIGVFGYMHFERLGLLDAFLNAAMLLGGMGPIHVPVTTGGKLFASFYALYAGLVFVAAAALVFTPIAHRALHKFHLDAKL